VFLRVLLIARRQQAGAAPRRPRSGLASILALALLVGLGAGPLGAQQGPIRLFPDQLSPTAPPAPGPGHGTPGAVSPGSPAGPETTSPPPQGFQVEGLAPPEVDAIGVAGGFEGSLWAGSDPELILTLLSHLPVASRNPPLAALTRRILATGVSLEGATEGGRVLSARVERLLAMGDLDSAKQLLDQLPASEGDSALARLAAEVALLAGDDPAACQRAADLAPTGDGEFWAEIAVYCRLAAGDRDGASLGLDLLREAGQTDDAAFFQLAGMVADPTSDTAPPALGSARPVHIALLRLAEEPLPAYSLGSLPPAALAAAAREPRLAGERQLEVAERAFRTGGLAAPVLAALYAEQAPEGDALAGVGTAWGPPARAMAYRAADEAEGPAELAALLDATWRAASGDERFLVAETLAGRFVELPADRAWSAVAPSAARALLAADRPLPAAHWFSLLEAEAASDGRARRELAALTPLFALAGIGGRAAVPELDEAAVEAWRAATPDADAKAERLFALLEGVGSPVPDRVWWQELEAPFERAASIPAGPLWRGLERAVADRRLGETVLFALNMLNGQPESAHPVALTGVLRALRAVGLDREARAIAVATAIVMDL
jgi:hypothetical protein